MKFQRLIALDNKNSEIYWFNLVLVTVSIFSPRFWLVAKIYKLKEAALDTYANLRQPLYELVGTSPAHPVFACFFDFVLTYYVSLSITFQMWNESLKRVWSSLFHKGLFKLVYYLPIILIHLFFEVRFNTKSKKKTIKYNFF